ncbi:MAG: site-specific integrase [Clostridia bacterium]|nr:site-specific integrase [Clostridia bacterium]
MKVSLKIKGDRYYAVINYKERSEYKQKWIALGLPAKNNKRKAEEMLEEIKREYSDGYQAPAGDMMFTSYIKRWLASKKPCVELSTWEGYQIYAERHIIPYFDPLRLSLREVKPRDIQAYYQYKYTQGRLDGKEGGLSIPSIRKHAIVIKEVFDDAVLEDLVLRNPAVGVRMPAKNTSTRERVFLTEESANELLRAFEGHPLQPLVYVALYYGLRRSEVLGLRWSAIDFDHDKISINHTVVKNKTIVRKDTTKTQCSFHTYLLIKDVKDVLLRRLEEVHQREAELGGTYTKTDYVFTWDDGRLLRPDYITKAFQKVLEQHGIPHMRFHDLRHSTASVLYDKGWDLKDIQIWMRHSSIDVTSDIYTHITANRKSKMAQTLNSLFKI